MPSSAFIASNAPHYLGLLQIGLQEKYLVTVLVSGKSGGVPKYVKTLLNRHEASMPAMTVRAMMSGAAIQYLRHARVTEDYILVLDSDMLLRRPLLPAHFRVSKNTAAAENMWYAGTPCMEQHIAGLYPLIPYEIISCLEQVLAPYNMGYTRLPASSQHLAEKLAVDYLPQTPSMGSKQSGRIPQPGLSCSMLQVSRRLEHSLSPRADARLGSKAG